MKSFLGAAVFAAAIAIAPLASAGHVTPTAPGDYLSKENPYDPEDFDKKIAKKAKRLYKSKCKKCHGTNGDGKGTAAADMVLKPTAFNAPGYLEEKSDGQLFWITEKGSQGTEMKAFGPGSDVNLSEDEIWRIITHIRVNFNK